MLENIIDFYKKDISINNLVLKHIKWWKWSLLLSASITTIITINWSVSQNFSYYYTPFFLTTLILFNVLNIKAKKLLEQKYNLQPEDFLWRTRAFDSMRLKMLKDYLDKNNLLNQQKLELTIKLLLKDSDRKKNSNFISAGLILAMILPIWSYYVGWIFREVKTFEEATTIILTFSSLAVMIAIIVQMIKRTLVDILDTESKTLNNLARMIEEVQLLI